MREIIFFAIICVAIFGCNDSSKKVKEQKLKNDYPAYIIKSFMNGCLEDNPNPDVTQTLICSCLMEKIQRKYTLEEFLELSKEQHGSQWDDYQIFLNKAAEECINNNTNK
jgi:hypothetical protein